jgi:hypothetical protein
LGPNDFAAIEKSTSETPEIDIAKWKKSRSRFPYLLREAIRKGARGRSGHEARRPARSPSERREKKMTTRGKNGLVARAQQLSAGAARHLANKTQVEFAGGPFAPAQITTKLQSIVTLRSDVDAARATARAKVAAERADMPALRAFTGALVAYVKATFGGSPEVLADFGIVPKAPAPRTAVAKAAAAAKGKATRLARGTLGSKQKKAVKGDVVGITVTPVTAAGPVVKAPSSPAAGAASPAGAAAPAPRTAT